MVFINPKGQGSESLPAGSQNGFHAAMWVPSSMRTETPLFETSPYTSLHLAVGVDPLLSLVISII